MSHTLSKIIAGVISLWFVLYFLPLMLSLNETATSLDQTVPDNILILLLSVLGILIVGIYGVLGLYFIIGATEDIGFAIYQRLVKQYYEKRKLNDKYN